MSDESTLNYDLGHQPCIWVTLDEIIAKYMCTHCLYNLHKTFQIRLLNSHTHGRIWLWIRIAINSQLKCLLTKMLLFCTCWKILLYNMFFFSFVIIWKLRTYACDFSFLMLLICAREKLHIYAIKILSIKNVMKCA